MCVDQVHGPTSVVWRMQFLYSGSMLLSLLVSKSSCQQIIAFFTNVLLLQMGCSSKSDLLAIMFEVLLVVRYFL